MTHVWKVGFHHKRVCLKMGEPLKWVGFFGFPLKLSQHHEAGAGNRILWGFSWQDSLENPMINRLVRRIYRLAVRGKDWKGVTDSQNKGSKRCERVST